MTIYHPARSIVDLLLFLPVAACLPDGPHRLAIPANSPTHRQWWGALQEFLQKFFPSTIRVLQTATHPRADLSLVECPTVFPSLGYLQSQALWAGVSPQSLPSSWVRVRAPKAARRGVVIARSTGAHNEFFPWGRILQNYKESQFTFCGSTEELDAFENQFPGVSMEWVDSADLVDSVELLARSELLISNQGVVAALADGVGTPTVLEVSLAAPFMLHPRKNVFPSFGGRTFLPELPVKDGGGEWVSSEISEGLKNVHWPRGYPAGWVYPDPRDARAFIREDSLDNAVTMLHGLLPPTFTTEMIRDEVVRFTVSRFPEELLPSPDHRGFRRVVQAMEYFKGPFPLSDYFFQLGPS